ncbi:MAG: hypothetical protein KKH68_04270, partial [Proteobacteria bacterium]|nr:hypothetical protein [Pseudomonadota bacterium]
MEQWNFGMMGINVFYQLQSTKNDDLSFLLNIPLLQHSNIPFANWQRLKKMAIVSPATAGQNF